MLTKVGFSVLMNVSREMVILGQLKLGTLYYLCSFSLSLKLLQNKILLEKQIPILTRIF